MGQFGLFSPSRTAIALSAILALSPVTASAQSLFDLFFGGGQRRAATASSYADPNFDGRSESRRSTRSRSSSSYAGGGGGGGTAYCVRMCDGRYFPLNARGGDAVEACNSFCPAAPTKVFTGGAIENSYASDGKRYSDIPNAFVYRAKLVTNCTCDGKSPTGLKRVSIDDDDTLRKGDFVATAQGLMSYKGESRKTAQFSPISASSIPADMRRQLLATRVVPDRTAEEMKGADQAAIVSRNVDQRSQAAR